jgi:23S rRNA pseudouridine2604 synthase
MVWWNLRLVRLLQTSSRKDTPKTDNLLIRVSKRMSELDLCSRREADQLLAMGKVLVNGVIARVGQKVKPNEINIIIVNNNNTNNDNVNYTNTIHYHDGNIDDDDDSNFQAIVLNKPMGYVSGQPEDGHIPAIKLIKLNNLYGNLPPKMSSSFFSNNGYKVAGRLDLDSTGLLIFSKSGVVSKKLISESGRIEKEYIVHVQKAEQVMRVERERGMVQLPPPSHNLKLLLGKQTSKRRSRYLSLRLLGDPRPLKPIVAAEWIERGKILRLVLQEGRKHQIRRMLREFLGFHVTQLQRIRIGPVKMKDLPEGQWRPLTCQELKQILNS